MKITRNVAVLLFAAILVISVVFWARQGSHFAAGPALKPESSPTNSPALTNQEEPSLATTRALTRDEELSFLAKALVLFCGSCDPDDDTLDRFRDSILKSPIHFSANRFIPVYNQKDGYREVSRMNGSQVDYSKNAQLRKHCESIGLQFAGTDKYPKLVADLDVGPEPKITISMLTKFGEGFGEVYQYKRTTEGFSVHSGGSVMY